ncbi:hypothetical protein [Chitinophaga sp. sic0106]|uniref:MutS-related protein n=1 Tax=Chitinophaga sp. sic0106 TaxID=2854785 RepID=UPI001C47BEF7|nr:hypothetical protein [Chitinophaga sp. sic0106]MBV7528986.1 hypothetical protein [Chitinophaga sp. sic0106]
MAVATIYQQRIDAFKADIAKEQKTASLLAWLRLAAFIAAVWGIVQYIRSGYNLPWLLLTLTGIVGFLVLLKRYTRSQDKLQLFKVLLELNEKELALVMSNVAGFADGSEFIDDRHDFTGDLDVFGPASIYQHINRTGTLSGSRKLAESLRNPLQDARQIRDTQEALRVLTPMVDFRQQLTATATLAKENDQDKKEINLWMQMPLEFLGKQKINLLRWGLPVLFVAAVFIYAFTGAYYWMLLSFSANWMYLITYQKRILAQHNLMAHKERILSRFDSILLEVRKASFGNARLLLEQQAVANEADTALRKLAKISSALDQRMNLLVAVVINPILMYDVHCIVRLEKWKHDHRQDMNKWLDVISQMEAWDSLATFAYNHQEFNWPVVKEGKLVVVARALGHPLIPVGECVQNDGEIGTKADFLIITGSNMSGKSTFLRSVGSNLLLAMCGAPVCAQQFEFTPMHIMTSMRIKDSIASHTSYFQAELLRLQHIIQHLKQGRKVFVLLDEILKGTNSEDKLTGSRSLIEHFISYTCLGMVATHDLELGHLEDTYPTRIRNYCFESTIQDDHLYFDYRMREGIARNKNATFLMKQMQII